MDQPLTDESPTDLTWLLAGHLGTITDVAEYDSGTNTTTVVNHLTYTSYGEIASQNNSSKEPYYTYTAREWDVDASLYYYRARWYDPIVGRFVSEDPIGFDSFRYNSSLYVGNSSICESDPSGLHPFGFPLDYNPPQPPPKPRPTFPRPGGTGTSINNSGTITGQNCSLFECPPTIASGVTPNPNPGPAPKPIPWRPPGGSNNMYGIPSTTPIGGGGALTCTIVVIKCPTGIAVYHFTPGDNPWSSLSSINWTGCEAIMCGGDDTEKQSQCLRSDINYALPRLGINVVATLGGSSCGYNPDGTIYEIP